MRTSRAKAILAFTCTFTWIQCGVGGRNRNYNFGEAKRDPNTYTQNMTFTLQIPWYLLYDGGKIASTQRPHC